MLITNETTYKLLSDREECNQALYSLIITGHACHYMHNGNLVYSSNGNLLVGNNRNLKYFMFVNGWNNNLFWYNLQYKRLQLEVAFINITIIFPLFDIELKHFNKWLLIPLKTLFQPQKCEPQIYIKKSAIKIYHSIINPCKQSSKMLSTL